MREKKFVPRDTTFTETAIIASLACNPANLKKISLIADDFKNMYSRSIFETIAKMVNAGEEARAGEGGLAVLGSMLDYESQMFLTSVLTHPLAEFCVRIEILERELRKIQAENLVGEIVARENITDPEFIANLIQQKLKELSTINLKSGREIGVEVYREIEKLQELNGALSGITSGVQSLDEYTHGFQDGMLYIIAGRTSMGKSAVLANLFLSALAEKKNPVFVTLEESDKSLAMRLASILSGISSEKARSGKLSAEEWEQTMRAADYIAEMEPKILSAHGMTADQISAKVNMVNNSCKIGMIIVDHLHEIKHAETSKFESEPSKIGKTLQVLRTLCVKLNVPLILAAQINREVEGRENKRPGMGNLKGSGSIEQVADMIWILYRQSYYDLQRPQFDTIEINVAKNRNGRTGVAKVGFEPSSLKVFDWHEGCYLGMKPELPEIRSGKKYKPYAGSSHD